MKFLIEFINDFKKPIERGNKTHVEYVPTQVVTEYIRYSFKNSTKEKIDGIIYPSSKNEGQKALVIFANSDQCVEQEEATEDGAILQLCSVENHPL